VSHCDKIDGRRQHTSHGLYRIFPENPGRFYHLTGKGRRDLGLPIHCFHSAAVSLKLYRSGLRGGWLKALIPTIFQSPKQHARMKDQL
jgi:hypothetical protein